MTARNCPHCSAPVRGDGRPACLCAAAGADDFDPLHVRPYVSLPDEEEGAGEDDGGRDYGRVGGAGAGWAAAGRGEGLDGLPGVDAAVHRTDASASASAAFSPSSGPLVPRARRRSGPTSRTFSAAEGEPWEPSAGPARSAPRRPRARPAALVATGAAAAVAAALLGTDALSGGTRDRAAPPDRSTASPSAALPTGDAPTPSGPASSPAAGRSPSPDATVTGPPRATVKLYRTPHPRPPAPTRASGSVTDSSGSPAPSAPPTGPLVLREGAAGPEVAELQGRLRQRGLYPGAGAGRFDAAVRAAVSRYQRLYGVTGDPDGVYGAGTRASLESRTAEP